MKNEIIMKFKLGDTAFLIENDCVYFCEIVNREFFENSKGEVIKKYLVKKEIQKGLFNFDYQTKTINEDKLFLSKKEAKDFVENLKEMIKVVDDF